jgi:hypothetical protein
MELTLVTNGEGMRGAASFPAQENKSAVLSSALSI